MIRNFGIFASIFVIFIVDIFVICGFSTKCEQNLRQICLSRHFIGGPICALLPRIMDWLRSQAACGKYEL